MIVLISFVFLQVLLGQAGSFSNLLIYFIKVVFASDIQIHKAIREDSTYYFDIYFLTKEPQRTNVSPYQTIIEQKEGYHRWL